MSSTFHITLSPNNAPIHTKVLKLYLSYIKGVTSSDNKPEFIVKETNDAFKMVELTHGSRVVKGSFAVLLFLEKFFSLDLLKFGSVGSVQRALIYSYTNMETEAFVANLDRFENEFICHKSYVLGHCLSIADFYVFAIMNECTTQWLKEEFVSTKRYFKFIAQTPELKEGLKEVFGELPQVTFNPAPFEYKPVPEIFAAPAPKGEGKEQGGKKDKKEKKEKKKAAAPQSQTISPNCIDIRVGRIVEAIRHPEADKLYIEKIDVGEESPRTIVSGLYQKIPLEKLQGSLCLVMTNLKPAVMVGVESSGMLLSAVTGDSTQFDTLNIPEGTVPGERVIFTDSDENEKPDGEVNSKKLRKYMPNFKTNEKGEVFYHGDVVHIAKTSKGIITSPFSNGLVA